VNESKTYNRIVTLGFAVILAGFFLLHLVLPDRAFSPEENRMLQQAPPLSLSTVASGSFMSGVERYANDQFPFRAAWIGGKAQLERMVGKQENNGIYFTDDILIARYDHPDEALVNQNMEYATGFALRMETQGVETYLSLIPNAAYLWYDELPRGAPNADQYRVMRRLSESRHYYSTNAAMTAHKAEALYYRTDHHWTSLGAYYGYEALMKALGMQVMPLEQYSPVIVSGNFYGTSQAKAAAHWIAPDDIVYYVPEEFDGQLYDSTALDGRDKYAFFLGGNEALRVVETKQEDKPKLLLLRDSHADAMTPFLTPHFSEIHLIDLRYYKQSIPAYVAAEGIDAVVLLYGVSNFTSDTNLYLLSLD
jgi:hypothetical protein